MTTLSYFLAATAVSLLAAVYLLGIDPKRRRVFRARTAPQMPQSRMLGWAMVFLPGLILAIAGEVSALLCWFGATSVLPWLIAARVPKEARER